MRMRRRWNTQQTIRGLIVVNSRTLIDRKQRRRRRHLQRQPALDRACRDRIVVHRSRTGRFRDRRLVRSRKTAIGGSKVSVVGRKATPQQRGLFQTTLLAVKGRTPFRPQRLYAASSERKTISTPVHTAHPPIRYALRPVFSDAAIDPIGPRWPGSRQSVCYRRLFVDRGELLRAGRWGIRKES